MSKNLKDFFRPHDVLASEVGAWSPLSADKILYVDKFSWFYFLDHMMFLLLKLECGHLFHHYFIADTILYVGTFTCFNFMDHMMFLLLKLERGHLFHHYFIVQINLHVETFN